MSAENTASSSSDGRPEKRTGTSPVSEASNLPRKRKGEVGERSEEDEHQVKLKCFREPHCQIEKRRRDKINNLIDELSLMIPACNPMARKLDKLTVLRMAVQHLKSLKGTSSSFIDNHCKPSFLPQDDLKHLVLRAADGFLFVVSCDRGKILFASESVSKILNFSRLELIGQSLFDYIHPKDISKVKEQLSASELYPRDRLIDTKTGLQVQTDLPLGSIHLCTGARRSFFYRMKHSRVVVKSEERASKKKESQRYCTVHCTGYMRSWPSSYLDPDREADKRSSQLTCLIAVCRIHPHMACQSSREVEIKPLEFVTRCAIDGKFTFVDQQATTIIGYLPQELLGTSCYEYFHQDDLQHLSEIHRKVLRSKEKIETHCYKFKTRHGSFVPLQSQWFSFINPWTKEVEFIVSTNKVFSGQSHTEIDSSEHPSSSMTLEEDTKSIPPIIPGISGGTSTMIYAGSIGTQIANELIDSTRHNSSPSSGAASPFCPPLEISPLMPAQSTSNVSISKDTSGRSGLQSDARLAVFAGNEAPADTDDSSSPLDLDSMVVPSFSNLSNDEAAMAVIMSLLETDTNLGDAVDFENMHWSL
ncbi:basic helix-loop-helix ARNT-like protein 2 [Aplochiton taeniatus]